MPTGAKSGGQSGGKEDDMPTAMDSVLTVPLSTKRIARVYMWSSMPLVDIREIYMVNDQARPGKKGISLTASQWRSLLARSDDITRALEDLEAKHAPDKDAPGETSVTASAKAGAGADKAAVDDGDDGNGDDL